MKGKIVYAAVAEKEIEIPDEIIEINEKAWCDWTKEEDEKMKIFFENTWDSICDDNVDRMGIYYEKNGKNLVLEEY